MRKELDIFNIETNGISPKKGQVLISEPFLLDHDFNRSVILLIDHGAEGAMGLILNKPTSILVSDLVEEFKYFEEIPVYKGGPVGMDTLFYLHTIENVADAISIGNGLYLNGDFNAIKRYIFQGNPVEGNIRFFLGYSGWSLNQLEYEIGENTWMISSVELPDLLNSSVRNMWKKALGNLGGKYATWSRFPKVPSLN